MTTHQCHDCGRRAAHGAAILCVECHDTRQRAAAAPKETIPVQRTTSIEPPPPRTKGTINAELERLAQERYPGLTKPQAVLRFVAETTEGARLFAEERAAPPDPAPKRATDAVPPGGHLVQAIEEVEIEPAIERLRRQRPELSREQAYTEVVSRNPDLYARLCRAEAAQVRAREQRYGR